MPIILVGKYYVDSVGTECVALAPVVAPVVAFAFAQLFVVDNFLFLAEPDVELSVDIVVIVDTAVIVVVVVVDDHFVHADPAATAVEFVDSVHAVADFAAVVLTVYLTAITDLYVSLVVLDRICYFLLLLIT